MSGRSGNATTATPKAIGELRATVTMVSVTRCGPGSFKAIAYLPYLCEVQLHKDDGDHHQQSGQDHWLGEAAEIPGGTGGEAGQSC